MTEERITRGGTTIVRRRYPDGALRYEHRYRAGRFHGTWRGWWENGTLLYESHYRAGEPCGTWRGWWQNGALRYEEHYPAGRR